MIGYYDSSPFLTYTNAQVHVRTRLRTSLIGTLCFHIQSQVLAVWRLRITFACIRDLSTKSLICQLGVEGPTILLHSGEFVTRKETKKKKLAEQ